MEIISIFLTSKKSWPIKIINDQNYYDDKLHVAYSQHSKTKMPSKWMNSPFFTTIDHDSKRYPWRQIKILGCHLILYNCRRYLTLKVFRQTIECTVDTDWGEQWVSGWLWLSQKKNMISHNQLWTQGKNSLIRVPKNPVSCNFLET